MQTTSIPVANGTVCAGDRVSYLEPLGSIVGRVVYLHAGWVGVEDENGRVDEYRPALLYRH